MARRSLAFLLACWLAWANPSAAQIPGIFQPAMVGAVGVVLTFDAETNIQAGGSPNTFTSVALGTPSPDRLILLGIGVSSGSGMSITSVTIGGVTATQLTEAHGAGGISALYAALVPTGTTGNIVVTTPYTPGTIGFKVWDIKNYNSATPTNTYTAGTTGGVNPASVSANISAGGIAVGFIGNLNVSASVTFTWAGITKNGTDQDAGSGVNRTISGASASFPAAQTGLTVSATSNGSVSYNFMVVGAFR